MSEYNLGTLMNHYLPGDEHEWQDEFDWLIENHGQKCWELLISIWRDGQKEPILLGKDNRVWDGHHRILVHHILGYETIDVEFVDE